jgi:hypothetical protein
VSLLADQLAGDGFLCRYLSLIFESFGQRVSARGSTCSMSKRVWVRIASSSPPSGRKMNFEHAGVDIFGDARQNRVGVADRECVRCVSPGAFGVDIHRWITALFQLLNL